MSHRFFSSVYVIQYEPRKCRREIRITRRNRKGGSVRVEWQGTSMNRTAGDTNEWDMDREDHPRGNICICEHVSNMPVFVEARSVLKTMRKLRIDMNIMRVEKYTIHFTKPSNKDENVSSVRKKISSQNQIIGSRNRTHISWERLWLM